MLDSFFKILTSCLLSGVLFAIFSMFRVGTTRHFGNIRLAVPNRLTNIDGGFISSEICDDPEQSGSSEKRE